MSGLEAALATTGEHAPRDPWMHQVLWRADHSEDLQRRVGDEGVVVRDAEQAADVGVEHTPPGRPPEAVDLPAAGGRQPDLGRPARRDAASDARAAT